MVSFEVEEMAWRASLKPHDLREGVGLGPGFLRLVENWRRGMGWVCEDQVWTARSVQVGGGGVCLCPRYRSAWAGDSPPPSTSVMLAYAGCTGNLMCEMGQEWTASMQYAEY